MKLLHCAIAILTMSSSLAAPASEPALLLAMPCAKRIPAALSASTQAGVVPPLQDIQQRVDLFGQAKHQIHFSLGWLSRLFGLTWSSQ
jgi:hypothetical protein